MDWRTYQHSSDEDGWEILIERRAFEATEEVKAHCADYRTSMEWRLLARERMYRNLPMFWKNLGNQSAGGRSNGNH